MPAPTGDAPDAPEAVEAGAADPGSGDAAPVGPVYFETPAAFRRWLETHADARPPSSSSGS